MSCYPALALFQLDLKFFPVHPAHPKLLPPFLCTLQGLRMTTKALVPVTPPFSHTAAFTKASWQCHYCDLNLHQGFPYIESHCSPRRV